MSLAFFQNIVIQVEINEIVSVMEGIETVVCKFNVNIKHSICINELLTFECLHKEKVKILCKFKEKAKMLYLLQEAAEVQFSSNARTVRTFIIAPLIEILRLFRKIHKISPFQYVSNICLWKFLSYLCSYLRMTAYVANFLSYCYNKV